MEPTVSKIWKLQPPRIHQVGPNQMQVSMLPSQSGAFQAIVVNNPGGASVGPIMKVKHFRIHAVTDQTILFNWALIYAPDGIGVPNSPTWSVLANRGTAAVCDCFGHLSCFSFKRGGCQSLRYYSPLARNLNPGDGIYLRMSAASASSIPVVWTINFVTCVTGRSDSGPAAQACRIPEASGRRVPL